MNRVARVLFWQRVTENHEGNRVVVPAYSVTSIQQVPKYAKHVYIVTFDEQGNPIPKIREISREELETYTLVS